jgi:hypothetical protein
VNHEVTGGAFPAWVGTTHQQHLETAGETLTLRQDFTTVDGVAVAARRGAELPGSWRIA